jgi:hypothetical protein
MSGPCDVDKNCTPVNKTRIEFRGSFTQMCEDNINTLKLNGNCIYQLLWQSFLILYLRVSYDSRFKLWLFC